MPTRQEVNTDVNNKIRNKTTSNRVDNVEDADNRNLILDYLDQKVAAIPESSQGPAGLPGATGAQGNAGSQGIQGIPGVVGPSGLNWQGQWVSGTSYVADDAVGYNGASWFCILATSGTINPFQDSLSWALLASQGANGAQGVQGLTGLQGLPGASQPKTLGQVIAISGSKAILQYDINNVTKQGGSDVKLPSTTEIGKEVLFFATGYSASVRVYVNDLEEIKLSGGINGISGAQDNLQITANEAYRFIYLANGYWYFEKIIDIPTNLYQLQSERTTDGTLATNSNFKYPTEQAVKTYVDANIGGQSALEYSAQIFQENTENISPQFPQQSNLLINEFGSTNYRKVVFARIGIGHYSVSVRYTPENPTNVNKLAIMFSDGTVRIEGGVSTGSAGNFQFRTWQFKTYTPQGVLSDGMLLGNNGTFINIKLYP